MLTFKITEIPEGQSSRTIGLEPDDLDITPYEFRGGEVNVSFHRTLHHIRVNFEVLTGVERICDRSLEHYIHEIDSEYEVLFKAEVVNETEDENGAVRRFNFEENTFSIEEEVRDTILLNVPIKKLHPKFLDEEGNPTEFEDRTYGTLGNDEKDSDEPADPRFSELKKLRNNEN